MTGGPAEAGTRLDGNGTARLRMVKPCQRWPNSNIYHRTAHNTPDVIDCPRTYRQDPQPIGAVSFGVGALTLRVLGQALRTGQPLQMEYGLG